jgi:probable addiction module antidote protein
VVKLTKFDPADYLKSPGHMALYLDACIQEGGDDPAFIASGLGDIAPARGMTMGLELHVTTRKRAA